LNCRGEHATRPDAVGNVRHADLVRFEWVDAMQPAGSIPTVMLPSDSCSVADLHTPYRLDAEVRAELRLEAGWARRWTAAWRFHGAQAEVVCPVQGLTSVPLAGCEPVRRFTWRPRQRHRPGLQFLVSTGRHHGFESLAEQRLLLALDFAGGVIDVLSQPFRLRFATTTGWREHTPDFLVVSQAGRWLFDVRPAERIGEDDQVCFAAADEAALASGWRYEVVTGWWPHVLAALDTLASQRRDLDDRLGLQGELCKAVQAGPRPFGELAAATSLPAVARAHALHLLWHRQLGVDLARPLTDGSLVWLAGVDGGR
jgi:hypothetical protein